MELLAFLRTLRRRWLLIVAVAVAGAAIGAASSAFSTEAKKGKTFYKATHTLVVDTTDRSGQVTPAFTSLDQVAIFTTTGDVPDAVAKKLGSSQPGRKLAEHITTTVNNNTNSIDITAADPDPAEAVRLADTFADQVVTLLDKRAIDNYSKTRDTLSSKLNDLSAAENLLLGQLATSPKPDNYDNIKAQYDATVSQYSLTYATFVQLGLQGAPTSRFTTLQNAQAVPIDQDEYNARLNLGATGQNNLSTSNNGSSPSIVSASSSVALESPESRGALGGLIGLIAGIGLALVLDRLDRRLRTRAEAEAAFGLPVLAEVPQLGRAEQREPQIVAHDSPLSRFAEAHRAVRSSILFTHAAVGTNGSADVRSGNGSNGSLFEPESDEPIVIMITSAAPGEGKTTTTANLAAVFAEAGSSVLVVNCDFRRPAIHRYFGVPDEPRRVLETPIADVKIVTNVLTDPSANPAQVVAAQRQVVAAARGRFDVILLDTAPLLTANDAVEMVGSADLVLLVARAGTTAADGAQRTVELLNRMEVALAGVVLVGVQSASNDYYYYYQPGRIPAGDTRKIAGRTTAAERASARVRATGDLFTDEAPIVD